MYPGRSANFTWAPVKTWTLHPA